MRCSSELSPCIKSWIYYWSLFAVLLLSLFSYFIANLAHGHTSQPTYYVSYYVIAQYSLMAFFMLLAWYCSPNASHIRRYRALLFIAIISRVILIDIDPYTSNDVDRYLFDGRIAFEGFDPYQVSHNDTRLTELRAIWQPPQEHAKYVTLYPPVSLALFTLASSFGVEKAQLAWQFILLIAGLLTVWVTALVLKHNNTLKHLPLVALSPLLILETGVGLHIDALSTLAIITAIYLWQRKKIAWCGVAIGLGMSIKVLPVMLLLPLFFIQRTIKGASALVINSLLTVGLIYLTTYALGFYPVGSIGVFFEKWRSASPLFSLIDNVLSSTQIIILLLSIVIVFASSIAYLCFKHGFVDNKELHNNNRSKNSNNKQLAPTNNNAIFYACLQLSVALPLLVSPVLFPWYLLPLVPLLALWPNKYLIIWMLIMPLTYEVLGNFLAYQQWQPAQWPIVILGIFYLFALANIFLYMVKHFQQSSTINNTAHASSDQSSRKIL